METQVLDKKKPKLWTKAGLQALGNLIKQSRNRLKLSQREVSALIQERTGCYVSDTSLGDIERNVKEPKWNTLAAIAAAEFVLKDTGKPYSVEEFSAIASESESECFFNTTPVKSVRRTQKKVSKVTDEEDFLPPLTTKGGRRLRNLVLAECSKRGWDAQELIAAGCDAELYEVIMREDWFQRYPSPQLIEPLAALLSKVKHWEGENPILGVGTYKNQVLELWQSLESNGIATHIV